MYFAGMYYPGKKYIGPMGVFTETHILIVITRKSYLPGT